MDSEVKNVRAGARRRGLSHHFEGWQVALVSVVIATTFALLVVPRPAAPDALPMPRVDVREAEREAALTLERARAATREPLPYLVRAAGETVRAFGKAEAEGRSGDAARKLLELRGLAANVRTKHGDESLLRLLALQSELFLAALARYEAGASERAELDELGGAFLDKARASGWLAGSRLLANESERRAMFKVRWVEAAGLRAAGAFAPTANELRTYYRFLLGRPDRSRGAEEALRYVSAVEKVDLEYPGLFARGVIYYQSGQFSRASGAFQAHLAKHPRGPWSLRARNHQLAAAERTRDTTPPP